MKTKEQTRFCIFLPVPFFPRVLKLPKGLKNSLGIQLPAITLDLQSICLYTDGLFNM